VATESNISKDFSIRVGLTVSSEPVSALEERLTELFELLRDPLYRYLVALSGSESEAEDLTQEAFLRLYAHLQTGRTMENCRAWLFRVAHNLAVDYHRNNIPLEPLDLSEGKEIAALSSSPGSDAERGILEQEQENRFRVALGLLSEDERRCLNLRAEGLRYREISEVLGMRISTIENIIIRAVTKLKKDFYD
jgi:RNA polymerase sigma-70 factor (ECF subfamily)